MVYRFQNCSVGHRDDIWRADMACRMKMWPICSRDNMYLYGAVMAYGERGGLKGQRWPVGKAVGLSEQRWPLGGRNGYRGQR